ncbi:MAG: class I SAM-dependent methyltransferase [Synergistota bacterium]|nr:class I SAM-dependent methyltransferase [Synergistota bacterium]
MNKYLDKQTQDYYQTNAQIIAREYAEAPAGVDAWFRSAFPEGGRLLDVGAAAGRDVLLLMKAGYEAFGVDPCRELVEYGLNASPELAGRLWCDALPELETVQNDNFDGVLCSAVLMHLSRRGLADAAAGVRRVLKTGGGLLVSLPITPGGLPVLGRDAKGRLFNGLSPREADDLFSAYGFIKALQEKSADALGRQNRKWTVLVYQLKG